MATKPKIIFEDDHIMVLDKPTGWITNSASTTGEQPVVQDWIASNFQFPISNFQECRNGIVHRLDKETSGILLVAKTKKAYEDLQKQFKDREISKTYTALVHGLVEPENGEIKAPVGRLPWRRDRFGILPGGRESISKYEVIDIYHLSEAKNINFKDYSLLKFYPKTGRTHQIRIHAKYIKHPIVSDDFYAGRKTSRVDRKWCPRLFLHASEINITHPINGKKIKYSSNLPDDLTLALEHLEKLSQTS